MFYDNKEQQGIF